MARLELQRFAQRLLRGVEIGQAQRERAVARQQHGRLRRAGQCVLHQPHRALPLLVLLVVVGLGQAHGGVARGEPVAQIEQPAQAFAHGAARGRTLALTGEAAEVRDEAQHAGADRAGQGFEQRCTVGVADGLEALQVGQQTVRNSLVSGRLAVDETLQLHDRVHAAREHAVQTHAGRADDGIVPVDEDRLAARPDGEVAVVEIAMVQRQRQDARLADERFEHVGAAVEQAQVARRVLHAHEVGAAHRLAGLGVGDERAGQELTQVGPQPIEIDDLEVSEQSAIQQCPALQLAVSQRRCDEVLGAVGIDTLVVGDEQPAFVGLGVDDRRHLRAKSPRHRQRRLDLMALHLRQQLQVGLALRSHEAVGRRPAAERNRLHAFGSHLAGSHLAGSPMQCLGVRRGPMRIDVQHGGHSLRHPLHSRACIGPLDNIVPAAGVVHASTT